MKQGNQAKKKGEFFSALNQATSRQKPAEQKQQAIPPEVVIQNFQSPIEWFAQQVALMNHGNVNLDATQAKQVFNINGGIKQQHQEEPVQMGSAVIEPEPVPELPAVPVDPIQAMRDRLKGGKR